ncbi:MAG TPA: hypothetical protein VK843_10360 [Planctomycetota bacterium]|nr:hypothetical protein [Planctomycetota bacterium]
MNQILNNLGVAPVVLIALLTFATTVFWMIVGWRAMRAHERIASTLDESLTR